MRTNPSVRALGLAALSSILIWVLAACSGPSVQTGAVAGRVVKGGLVAVSGVVVRAQGKATLTDADGRFTLEGISVPYDLSLSQSSGDGWLHVLEGLTDRNPVVDPLGYSVTGGGSAVDVSGVISGGVGGWPLPVGRRVVICVEGVDVTTFGCGSVSPGSSDYTLVANLLSASGGAARLHALRLVVDLAGLPTAYEGYGSVDVVLEAGVPLVAPIALEAPTPVGDLEVAFDVPGGAVLTGASVVLRVGENGSIVLFDDAVVGASLTLPVPVLPGVRYGVFAGIEAGGGRAVRWSVADGLDVGTLGFSVPSQLATPPADAVGVSAATPFEVVVDGPGARSFRWTTPAGPDFAVTTTRTSVTLPDPVSAGFAWPGGATYGWNVFEHDAPSVDDVAGVLDTSFVFLAVYLGLDLPDDGSFSMSSARDVTLAP